MNTRAFCFVDCRNQPPITVRIIDIKNNPNLIRFSDKCFSEVDQTFWIRITRDYLYIIYTLIGLQQ